jgi:hypothetical protein
MRILTSFVAAGCFVLSTSAVVLGQDIILTVSGDVSASPKSEIWELTAEDLRELPVSSFATETIWTSGEQIFVGVSLVALLDHVKAEDGTLVATAINDYSVSIPTSDAVANGPIIAYLRNGKEMSLRDKGPLWIVYPHSDNAAYDSEEFYARSIWQLDRIDVVADK